MRRRSMRRGIMRRKNVTQMIASKNSVYFGKECSWESLEHVVQLLQTEHNCDVKLSVTPDFKLVGIFLQDDEMKRIFDAFPEILIIDMNQQLEDLDIPLFMLIVEDGNGISEVVAIGIFVLNDEATFGWFLETFQGSNPSFMKTSITVCNKHFAEREIIKEKFPNARHTLSLPYVLEVFRQKVMSKEMGIRDRKQKEYMQAFENMCYSTSVTKYKERCDAFKTIAPNKLAKYFKSKWHHNRAEWLVSLIFGSGNFVDKSHNRLSIFNSKVEDISLFVTLYEFVDKLFSVLPSVRSEGDKLALCEIEKSSSEDYEVDSVEGKYSKFLTPYAFKIILNQLSLSSEIDLIQSDNAYTLSAERRLHVTENECNCTFFEYMNLPCKHIFALQRKLNALKFNKELCGQRWRRDYYCVKRKIDLQRIETILSRSALNLSENQPLLMSDKFKNASIIGTEIATLISQSSSDVDFQEKIDFLESLFKNWSEGRRVKVQEETEACEAHSDLCHPTNKNNENIASTPMDIATEKSDITADVSDVTKECNIDDDDDDDIEMEEDNVAHDASNNRTQQYETSASNDSVMSENNNEANIVMVDPESILYAYEVEV